jgi:thioredoxin 1
MKEKAVYVILTDANFKREVLEGKEGVLVEFCASWSGSCQVIEPIFENLAADFGSKVKLGKLDVGDNKRVAKEYGIQTLPTFLFFRNGHVVDHIVGAVPKAVIRAKLKALMRVKKRAPRDVLEL